MVQVPLHSPNFVVISGGPGSGKTTVLEELAKLGFPHAPEVARQIIQEQRNARGTALPWSNQKAYTEVKLRRSIESYLDHASALSPIFSDRGIPDTLGYARLIGLEDKKDMPCQAISHGDMRIVEVGIVLASEPQLVFLDEPTAGMNPEETRRMVALIKNLFETTGTTFFLTEHDMNVVFSISHRIVVLNYGKILAEGSPEEIRRNQDVRKAYLGGFQG